jgi:hypothetical protein
MEKAKRWILEKFELGSLKSKVKNVEKGRRKSTRKKKQRRRKGEEAQMVVYYLEITITSVYPDSIYLSRC